ncbi:hypothetical protein WDW89_09990 [Deltaproteobacteria bacterium TL4]
MKDTIVFQILILIGVSALLLFACSTLDIEAKADLSVSPSATINAGESIILDASDSTYDDIKWFINGARLTECDDTYICRLLMPTAGSYEFRIDVKVEPQGYGGKRSTDSTPLTVTVL